MALRANSIHLVSGAEIHPCVFLLLCQPRADIRIRIRQTVIRVDVTGPAIRAIIHVAAANNNPRGPRLLNESRFAFLLLYRPGLRPARRVPAGGPPASRASFFRSRSQPRAEIRSRKRQTVIRVDATGPAKRAKTHAAANNNPRGI